MNRYEEPTRASREELDLALAAGDHAEVSRAMLGILEDSDVTWLTDTLLDLTGHESTEVRAAAITSLGHVARIRGEIDRARVLPQLRDLRSDPLLRGRVDDAIDDIDRFTRRGSLTLGPTAFLAGNEEEQRVTELSQQYPALWQFLGAYLHQDWPDEYESPSAALRDFVSGDPGNAVKLPTEIEQVITSTADDAALEEILADLGSFVPSRSGQNPRDWLRDLKDQAQRLTRPEDSIFLDAVRALLASTQRGEVTLAEFERRFLHLHAEMPLSTPEPSGEAIEDLFWVVEGFVAEPTLRTASDPDESALREAIGRCLTRIGS